MDGIDNATLVWHFGNGTSSNVTMGNSFQNIARNDANFVDTGYIDAVGSETTSQTERAYFNYTFDTQLIDVFDIRINDDDDLTYISIQIKNVTTNSWEPYFLHGSTTGTTAYNANGGTYDSNRITTLIAGIKIYAIDYNQGGNGQIPNLGSGRGTVTIDLEEEVFDGTIPAPFEPVFTTFYISAYDVNGTLSVSPESTYLSDSAPQIQIQNLPVSTKNDFLLNVTVIDPDDINTINRSSVIAYYRLTTETVWQSIPMTHVWDLDPIAIFKADIPVTALGGVETDLLIYVNASDIVKGKPGHNSTSAQDSVVIDSLGPRLTSLSYAISTFFANATSINTSADITTTFTDASGIKNATIFYTNVSSSNFNEMKMLNTTDIGMGIPSSSFNVTLPGSPKSGEVNYFFELTDFLDNKFNTSIIQYLIDGDGPVVPENMLLVHPAFVILNTTDARVLFNTTDISEVKNAVVWYSYDNGTFWNTISATLINYDSVKFPTEIFDAAGQLPFVLKNQATSFLSLPVSRKSNFQIATMNFNINHERSSDLRIWITTDNNKRILIFDRETDTDLSNLQFDLLDLGFVHDDFNKNNFTLEIQDFSSMYSGFVIEYRIELINFEIPIGYQYEATIPKTNNDTKVIFFITMTDFLDNVANSTIFSYHSDGTAPALDVEILNSPIDLEGSTFITIKANATDAGGIDEVEIYYRFEGTNDWTIKSMVFDSIQGIYIYNLPLPTDSGNVTYWIRAYDNVGLSNSSDLYSIVFEGATPDITDTDEPTKTTETTDKSDEDNGISESTMILIASILGAVAGVGVLIYLITTGKLKIPSRFRR